MLKCIPWGKVVYSSLTVAVSFEVQRVLHHRYKNCHYSVIAREELAGNLQQLQQNHMRLLPTSVLRVSIHSIFPQLPISETKLCEKGVGTYCAKYCRIVPKRRLNQTHGYFV